jgi:hypothetical protein
MNGGPSSQPGVTSRPPQGGPGEPLRADGPPEPWTLNVRRRRRRPNMILAALRNPWWWTVCVAAVALGVAGRSAYDEWFGSDREAYVAALLHARQLNASMQDPVSSGRHTPLAAGGGSIAAAGVGSAAVLPHAVLPTQVDTASAAHRPVPGGGAAGGGALTVTGAVTAAAAGPGLGTVAPGALAGLDATGAVRSPAVATDTSATAASSGYALSPGETLAAAPSSATAADDIASRGPERRKRRGVRRERTERGVEASHRERRSLFNWPWAHALLATPSGSTRLHADRDWP